MNNFIICRMESLKLYCLGSYPIINESATRAAIFNNSSPQLSQVDSLIIENIGNWYGV